MELMEIDFPLFCFVSRSKRKTNKTKLIRLIYGRDKEGQSYLLSEKKEQK